MNSIAGFQLTSVNVGGISARYGFRDGRCPDLTFTVNGVTNGNATVGTISGSSSPYTYPRRRHSRERKPSDH